MNHVEDGFAVEFTPTGGPRRRVRYEPRNNGEWWRVEEEHTGCSWGVTGCEPVRDVDLDATPTNHIVESFEGP